MTSGDKYRAIPLSEVVAAAKETLRISGTTEHDAFLTRLANTALTHLTDSTTYVKRVCDVPIVDGRAELPCGFVSLLFCKRLDDFVLNSAIYYDSSLILDDGIPSGLTPFVNDMQIVNGFIVFLNPSVPDGTLRVAFMGRTLDEDGFMVMSDRQERAIEAYICYKFCRAYWERFPQYVWKDYQEEWSSQKKYLTGLSAAERFQENKKEIASILLGYMTSDKNRLLGDE